MEEEEEEDVEEGRGQEWRARLRVSTRRYKGAPTASGSFSRCPCRRRRPERLAHRRMWHRTARRLGAALRPRRPRAPEGVRRRGGRRRRRRETGRRSRWRRIDASCQTALRPMAPRRAAATAAAPTRPRRRAALPCRTRRRSLLEAVASPRRARPLHPPPPHPAASPPPARPHLLVRRQDEPPSRPPRARGLRGAYPVSGAFAGARRRSRAPHARPNPPQQQ